MLPSDQENADLAEKAFARHFAAAKELLGLSLEAYDRFFNVSHPKAATQSRGIVSLVFHQTMRRFRAMIALCRIAYAQEAEILLRAVFESHLALRYMVKPLRLRTGSSPELRSVLKKLPPIPKGQSAGDFRALLYAASGPIKMHRVGERAKMIKGAKRVIPKAARSRMNATIVNIESMIGAGWMKALRDSKSYSGISQVKLLAEYCGQAKYYDIIYGQQSSRAHGEGATHLITDLDPKTIGNATVLGCAILGTCLEDMNKRFKLDLAREITAATKVIGSLPV